jgi:hypothetical protein
MTTFVSDITLGELYTDEQTGYAGVATAVYFYQHACERVCLETFDKKQQKVIEHTFDSPRLIAVKSGKKVETARTGGPERGGSRGGEIR